MKRKGHSGAGWSYTSTFQDCPRRFFWSEVRGYQLPISKISSSLLLGDVSHVALATFLRERDKDKAIRDALSYLDSLDLPNSIFVEMATKVDHLMKWYPDKMPSYLKPKSLLEIEKAFEYLTYSIRVDAIVKINDSICLVDHKTTSGNPSFHIRKCKTSGQFLGYLAVYNALHEVKANKVMLNIIELKNEVITEDVVTFSIREQAEFLSSIVETQRQINTLLSLELSPDNWEKRLNQCSGIWECPYIPLCKEGEVSYIIEHMYEVKDCKFEVKGGEKDDCSQSYVK